MLWGKVSIAQGHLDVPMIQELPHGIEVYPCHHQLAGEDMVQVMPAELGNSRILK
jgi:hypothetical protein